GGGAGGGGGGDRRCTCPAWPGDGSTPPIPCDNKTAHIAYILVAEKTDTNGDSHNNGQYSTYITVSQPEHGPNEIKPGENLNPVKTLRVRYDAWKQAQAARSTASRRSSTSLGRSASTTPLPGMIPPPPPPPPGAQRGAAPGGPGPGPGGRGGRGGGRGGVQLMTLTTGAWADGTTIPIRYTQAGDEVSPPLAWSNVPDGAASFVLIVHDPDAPIAGGSD